MKSIKYIALSAFVTLSVFSAVIFSACTKSECGAVVCLNEGACKGGICECKPGSDGVNCQNIYRNTYAHAYKGVPPDDPTSDTTNIIELKPTDDISNYNAMVFVWIDTTGTARLQLPIELYNNAPGGSNFLITSTTLGFYTYSGTGTVNGKELSMALREVDTTGASRMWYFNNYIKR